ncbi:TonB family protein [Pseudoduganella sp. GCM10020061]|uniref:TonB family protein n=1 Tax=Pseudoduganella sp. GCM10020061 TaxID=3317345 RepID=UPI0036350512
MAVAVTVSVLAHALLLAVRFVPPDAFRFKPVDPGLEVILVNAKHKNPPAKAEALAQANLEGGGNADAGRSKSPLPDLRRTDTGASTKATQRRIAELEAVQQNLLTRVSQSQFRTRPVTEKDKPDPTRTGQDLFESQKQMSMAAAEIAERIEEQNKRPRKTHITPSTRGVGYAIYYKTMQKKIEDVGTLNFPQKNGRKLYGELVMYIPVFEDGTIYKKEGIRVEKSSGNKDLDKAAMEIVRRSAPFGKFPARMLSSDRDDLWVVITRFTFTRDERLEADLRSGI